MMKMVILTVCLLGVLSAVLIRAESKPSASDTWWKPIFQLIQDPCSPGDDDQGDESPSSVPPFFPLQPAKSKYTKKRDCLPLNLSSFLPAAREGQDMAEKLLKDKRLRRWTRGRFADMARKLRCELKLCVAVKSREGLTKAQMKVTEDLIQLASYTNYLDMALSTLRSKKNSQVRRKMGQLSNKLKVISCTLRPSVNKSSLDPYVTRDDVPLDLRHKKRSRKGIVATYVILEKMETFLRELPGSYRRNGFKLCKNN